MAPRAQSQNPPTVVPLGDNPVDAYQARVYARESSPGLLAVLLELTENARDNGTQVTLTIDVADVSTREKGIHELVPRRIICEDNGAGLSHSEFLTRFCGAFMDSPAHHDTERAGRNGVGTKTYASVAQRVVVATTTARATAGLDEDAEKIAHALPRGVRLPRDGEPDTLRRVYEFKLHTRAAVPAQWTAAEPLEMGTRVEFVDLHEGTSIPYETLIERLSYAREWLNSSTNSLAVVITGERVPEAIKRRVEVRPWSFPKTSWLTQAQGRSDRLANVWDPTLSSQTAISAVAGLGDVLEFDFRVLGKDERGQVRSLDQPALLLEICGALPYPPNLEGTQSSRTLPLLSFVGLEHASSIGAFCNSVCGYARINSLKLKQALRNNKTTLAAGPETPEVDALRGYLLAVMKALHRAWYNATRSSITEAERDTVRAAEQEVNLALKGVGRAPFDGGQIVRSTATEAKDHQRAPARRHRWECAACGNRWLADAGFTPESCGQTRAGEIPAGGCGSKTIGLAKNQPRIADCQIRIEQLGDSKIPAAFQFVKQSEDVEVPTVSINLVSPRYVELRGVGNISGQAQKRLVQYLVESSLMAIASFRANASKSDVIQELGELYYGRMLRMTGVKAYEAQRAKILNETDGSKDLFTLAAGPTTPDGAGDPG